MKLLASLFALVVSILSFGQSRQTSVHFSVTPNSAYGLAYTEEIELATEIQSSNLYEFTLSTSPYIDGKRKQWNWGHFEIGFGINQATILQQSSFADPNFFGFVRRSQVMTSSRANLQAFNSTEL